MTAGAMRKMLVHVDYIQAFIQSMEMADILVRTIATGAMGRHISVGPLESAALLGAI